MSFEVRGQRVVVIGGGRSGRAAAELLVSRGASVTLIVTASATQVSAAVIGMDLFIVFLDVRVVLTSGAGHWFDGQTRCQTGT